MQINRESLDLAIKYVKHEIYMREVVFKNDPIKKKRKVEEMKFVLKMLELFKRMTGEVNIKVGGTDE